jgi:hypothetical protein
MVTGRRVSGMSRVVMGGVWGVSGGVREMGSGGDGEF